jgi:hypothetical protein
MRKIMNYLKLLVLSILLILFCKNVFSQSFQIIFENFEYGINIEQVEEMYSNTERKTELRYCPQVEYNILILDQIIISDEPFSVVFNFRGGALEYVNFVQKRQYTLDESEIVFDNIIKYLTLIYGNPEISINYLPKSFSPKTYDWEIENYIIILIYWIDDNNFEPGIILSIGKKNNN